ncbi:MAG: helix-turn-helix transcriptional regulator [Verrucomicrobiales bacterium]|nr:helix-turn-helix transcriptional regulator [Verrucomicrobiales bacterium]
MKGELANIVGPQIRKRRNALNWSQAKLAVKLQVAGFDISRESLAKVESQIHQVEDYQLAYYARALGISLEQLFPPLPTEQPIHDVIVKLRARRNGAGMHKAGVNGVNGHVVPGVAGTAQIRVNGHVHVNGARSVQKEKQMTLPSVQVRTESE